MRKLAWVLTLVAVAFSWMVVPASFASVQVSDKLSFFGDFRFRYEIDKQDRDASTSGDRERDRARVRARFGFKYERSKNVSFGLRLRTESNNNQSPHQTLGFTGGRSGNFGLDRAYVEFKILGNGFLWLGKHGISFWEQNEAFWDGDIQPEGLGLGYKFKLGSGGSLTLHAVHTYIADNSFGDNAAIFGDDTGTTIQAVYTRTMGPNTITLASGAMFVSDNEGTSLPGGTATYSIHSIQWKNKSIFPNVPIKLGFDYLVSSYDDSNPNAATGGSTADTDENSGYVINLAAKSGKWGFKVEHYYIELNSVPLQGLVAQDDFPFSSNFFGQKYQIGYNFGSGLSADFRVYSQEQILRSDLAGTNVGGFIQNVKHDNRYQVNLNIKF